MAEDLTPIYIARRLQQADLFYFTPSLLGDLLDLDRRRVYRLIGRLEVEGLAAEIERGKFLLLGLNPEYVLSNPLFIAGQLAVPSYVSYWSALHYYGFTEQVPLTVFVATTKKKRPVSFRKLRFRYITVKPRKFFGYRREILGGLPVSIADPAKALVDSLDQLRYAGGIGEVAGALRRALEQVNVATLVECANRMGDKSLASRLGYLLETFGLSVEGMIRSAVPIKLDPAGPRSGRTDPAWRVIVNIPETELHTEGVG